MCQAVRRVAAIIRLSINQSFDSGPGHPCPLHYRPKKARYPIRAPGKKPRGGAVRRAGIMKFPAIFSVRYPVRLFALKFRRNNSGGRRACARGGEHPPAPPAAAPLRNAGVRLGRGRPRTSLSSPPTALALGSIPRGSPRGDLHVSRRTAPAPSIPRAAGPPRRGRCSEALARG